MVVALKSLHLVALTFWCAALLALPLTLRWHGSHDDQARFGRLRQLTHGTYTLLATPAAVLAIGSGTALIFARGVFEPWMFAKLVAVSVLVSLHVFIGLVVERMGEQGGRERAPRAAWIVAWVAVTLACVLGLVLGKPAPPPALLPDWLSTPRHQPMPVAEPPRR